MQNWQGTAASVRQNDYSKYWNQNIMHITDPLTKNITHQFDINDHVQFIY